MPDAVDAVSGVFRQLLERSADAHFLLDGSGGECLACNRPLLEMLGARDAGSVRWPLLAREGACRFEAAYPRPDGTALRAEVLLTPLTLDDGRDAVHGTVRDVTAREQLAAALRETARGVSAATGDAFFRSLVEYLSRALRADYAFVGELTGADCQSVRTTAVCVDGQIVPNFEYGLPGTPCANVTSSFGEFEVCSYPSGVQALFPDDHLLVEMGVEGYAGTPLFGSGGRVLGLLVVLFRRAVTDLALLEATRQVFAARAVAELERARADAELRASAEALRRANDELEARVRERTAALEGERALLETVLRHMPAGALIAEAPSGRVLIANEQFARIVRFPAGQFGSVDDLKHLPHWRSDGRPYTPEDTPMRRALNGEVCEDEEIVVLRGDGTRGVLLTFATPVRDEAGEIAAVVGSGLDITHLKQTEEALRRLHDELEMQVEERTAELALANAALQAEVQERRRAEQVSRGQTAALARTIHALTASPDVDTFLRHLIQAIREQLEADGIGISLYDPVQDCTAPLSAAIGDQPLSQQDLRDRGVMPSLPAGEDPTWQAVRQDPRPFGVYDIPNDLRLVYREQFAAAGARSVLIVPLMLGDRPIGHSTIYHETPRVYGPEEIALAQALSQQATLAVQMARLAGQLQGTAVLQERNRLAREIHDTLAQGFAGVIVQCKLAEAALKLKPEKALPAIQQARSLAQEGLTEAKRSVWALRPNALEGGTLPDALQRLVASMTAGTGLRADVDVEGEYRALPSDAESHLLRIVQEALNNTLKYARASEASVALCYEPGRVMLAVRDNGVGFTPGARPRGSGFGHTGMAERTRSLGGELTIRSAPGQGTEITAAVPAAGETGEQP